MTKQGNFNQWTPQAKKTHSDLQTKKQQSDSAPKQNPGTTNSVFTMMGPLLGTTQATTTTTSTTDIQRAPFTIPHQMEPETDPTEPPPAPLRNKGLDLEVDNLALEGVTPKLASSDFVSQNYETLATLMQEETKKRLGRRHSLSESPPSSDSEDSRRKRRKRVSSSSSDPDDHLKIFESAATIENWPEPVWCHMFNSTLVGNAQNWFSKLPRRSIDGVEELRRAFRLNFTQMKKCAKNPVELARHFASVKHPQTNGLVERTNRSLGEGIKARLDKHKGRWVEELSHVLWAHRTTIKVSTRDTPFFLVYGTEAVIPAEIGMPTIRTAEVNVATNDDERRIDLDLLEERRERAAICVAKAKSKMKRYYDAKVRGVSFRP
nr:reverse transcriptase domain-containing protein [Tanacetum cinerariifolium]